MPALRTHPLPLALTLAASAICCRVEVAHAEESPQYSLAWSRSDAAEGCPDREALVAALAERLDREPFVDDSPNALSVTFDRTGETWQSTVQTQSAGVTDPGTQRLSSTAEECDELFSATVTTVGVWLTSGFPARDEPAAAEPPPEPTDAAGVEPQPEPTLPTSAPRPETPQSPSPTRIETPRSAPPPPAYSPKTWLGVELVQDLSLINTAQGVCSEDPSNGDYDCYDSNGDRYTGSAHPDVGNQVKGGLAPSTTRLLATVQYVLDDRYGIQLRTGLVIGGGARDSGPYHLELGGRYWFGQDFNSTRGFIGAGLGYASYDSSVEVTVLDCSEASDPDACLVSGPGGGGRDEMLTAVRRYGRGFASVSAGVLLMLGRHQGLLLQTALIGTLTGGGIVIEPSIGYSRGF